MSTGDTPRDMQCGAVCFGSVCANNVAQFDPKSCGSPCLAPQAFINQSSNCFHCEGWLTVSVLPTCPHYPELHG